MYLMIARFLKKILPKNIFNWISEAIMPLFRKALFRVLDWFESFIQDSAWLNFKRGYLLFRFNQIEEAIQSIEKAIEIDPDFYEAYSLKAKLLGIKGDINKEVSFCKEMAQRFVDNVEAQFILGSSLIKKGKCDEGIYHIFLSNKLKIAEHKRKGGLGLVFIASANRCGSGYTAESLRKGLSMPNKGREIFITRIWWPDLTMVVPPVSATNIDMKRYPIPEGFIADHLTAKRQNLIVINFILDRLVVQVRDPRAALASWVNYMYYFKHTNNIFGMLESRLPENYFLWSMKDQIDWQIDNFFMRESIKWIEEWFDTDENPHFYPKILFTSHENMVLNPKNHFDSILDFYEIDKSRFTYPQKPKFKPLSHFRKGSPTEWREIFTPEQVERASGMMPERLLTKFGWPTN
ncbi:MAG: hypothetical protein GY777_07765 [Candidatus Brocadiaceae bacterium]|nr:hypothetical protein [Candidatus Brocadiaceae bacterium]